MTHPIKRKQRPIYFTDDEWICVKEATKLSGARNITAFMEGHVLAATKSVMSKYERKQAQIQAAKKQASKVKNRAVTWDEDVIKVNPQKTLNRAMSQMRGDRNESKMTFKDSLVTQE